MIKYRTFSHLEQIILELSQLPSLSHPLATRWLLCPTISVSKRIVDEITERNGFFAQAQVLILDDAEQQILDRIYQKPLARPNVNEITTILLEQLDEILEQPQTETLRKIVGKSIRINQNQLNQSNQSNPQEESDFLGDAEVLSQKIQSKEQRRLVAVQKISKNLINILQSRPYWLQQWSQSQLQLDHQPQLKKLIEQLNETRSKSPAAYLNSFWPVIWQSIKQQLNSEVYDEFFLEKTLGLLLDQPNLFHQTQIKEIIIVGIHQIDPYVLMMYEILSQFIDVTIYALTPIPLVNEQIIESKHIIRQLKDKDLILQQLKNPINRHLGAQALNLPIVLQKRKESLIIEHDRSNQLQSAKGLLGQVQKALLTDLPRPLTPELVAHDVDQPINLTFHACHYASRQVDVLYDELCSLFRKDPTLKAREVLVLAPDIENYLPYIQSTFNGQNGRLGASIERFRARNICIDLLSKLIDLANGRFYRYDVFEILKQPAVCACFHLSLDEILSLENLIKETGIIWGKDKEHRLKLDLNESGHHTWAFGLDRILLGEMFGYVDEMIMGEIYPKKISQDTLLIKFFEFYTCLTKVTDAFSQNNSAKSWIKAIHLALDLMMTKEDPYLFKIENAKKRIEQILGSLKSKIQSISPSMIQGLLSGEIGEEYQLKNANQDFIFFSTIQKASVLNARVICLLGMNDDEYPQKSVDSRFLKADDEKFEILEDRSIAIQNVQFLQIIQQAKDALLIFYNSKSADQSPTLACLPVQLLQEEIKHRFYLSKQHNVIDQLTYTHPLHPFSYQNFQADQDNQPNEKTQGHQKIWFEGAKAWREAQINPKAPKNFAHPPITLSDQDQKSVDIEDLVQFFKKPSEYFLKNQIGIKLKADQSITREREKLELDDLEVWQVKDEILKFMINRQINPKTAEIEQVQKDCYQFLFQENLLPVGNMGKVIFDGYFEDLKALHSKYCDQSQSLTLINTPIQIKTQFQTESHLPFEISIAPNQVYQGKLLMEDISSLHNKDGVRFEKLVKLWIYHVALSANRDQMPYEEGILIGTDQPITLKAIDQKQAQGILKELCQMYLQGNTKPMRFDPNLSSDFAKNLLKTEDAIIDELENNQRKNDYHQIAFDQVPLFIQEKNAVDENGNLAIATQELHPEFKELANQFFSPLIDLINSQKEPNSNLQQIDLSQMNIQ